jgi:hypothetical protein
LRALPLEDGAPAAVARLLRQHLGSSLPGAGDPSLRGGAKAADARRLLCFLRALRDAARGSPGRARHGPSSAPAGGTPA